MRSAVLLTFALLLCAAPAVAQYDVSASVFAQYGPNPQNSSTSLYSGWNPGAQLALRHYVHPWYGWEASYSFNPQSFQQSGASGNQHTVLADYVINAHLLNFRAFLLGGVGDQYTTNPISNGNALAAEAGGGLDFTLVPHVGFRAQYRQVFTRVHLADSPTVTAPEYRPAAGIFIQF